jgi:hypothetical protein
MHHVDATLSEESRSGIQLNCLSVSPASSFFLESLESLVYVMYTTAACGCVRLLSLALAIHFGLQTILRASWQ